jgi:adenylate cyclase
LQDKLWGSRDQEHGRASLRSELSNLRACLAPHAPTLLASERDRVRLDLRQLSVDAHAYFLGEAPPSGWPIPGDFLEGLDLPGEDGFEDWLRDQRNALQDLASRAEPARPAAKPVVVRPPRRSICVLPFANMSADVDQDYFSDGISEDIITDLCKVSSLSVTARNKAFAFKGQSNDTRDVAAELGVEYVLGGSVRKAGERVRISAYLIDGATAGQVWAERWDRDLTDIFALQDEISESVVSALKIKLLPEERRAIERRGTKSSDAYNLHLMARQLRLGGNEGDPRREEEIIRLTGKATEIDPGYAHAWALMALSQTVLCFSFGRGGDDGLESAERALALDPDLAEAHAIKARHLSKKGESDEALAELEIALRLDPESWDANKEAGMLRFRQRRFEDAVRHYEKATELMETDFTSPMLLITCYTALGDADGARRAARIARRRAETASARDPGNGAAFAAGCVALAVLGEAEQSRDWARRALLIDPQNMVMRYNLACALSAYLKDADGALELLEGLLPKADAFWVSQTKLDPDFDPVRGDPRFSTLIAAAELRLAEAGA